MIATTTWALLRDSEQAALVRADPIAFAAATEESLRWMSPIAMYPRYVASDTRLGDVELPAGSRVGVMLASANRDERHWEEPDRFDLRRATSGMSPFRADRTLPGCVRGAAARWAGGAATAV